MLQSMPVDGHLNLGSALAENSSLPAKLGLEFGSFESRYKASLEAKYDTDTLEGIEELELEDSDDDDGEEFDKLSSLVSSDLNLDEIGGESNAQILSRPRSLSSFTNALAPKKSRSEGWKKLIRKFSKSTRQNLQEQHQFWLSVHGRLHHSPLSDSQTRRALEIGTGRGMWAMEFASKFRDCQVTGIDIQAHDNWKVLNTADQSGKYLFPNLQFQVHLLQPGVQWDFAEKFDFVHVRLLSYLVDHSVWFPSLLRNLNDGGWAEFNQWIIQIQSANGYSTGRGSAVKTWNALAKEGSIRLGKDAEAPLKFKSMLEEVGFEEVVQIRHDVPLNQWVPDPELRKLGEASYKNIIVALQPFSISTLGHGLGWTIDQIDVLLEEVRKDIENTDFHCFVPMMTTFCRKPAPTDGATSRAGLTAKLDPFREDCTYNYNQALHIPVWSET